MTRVRVVCVCGVAGKDLTLSNMRAGCPKDEGVEGADGVGDAEALAQWADSGRDRWERADDDRRRSWRRVRNRPSCGPGDGARTASSSPPSSTDSVTRIAVADIAFKRERP